MYTKHRKKLFIAIVFLVFMAIWFVVNRFALFESGLQPGVRTVLEASIISEDTHALFFVEEVVRGLEVPWSIVFTSVDRMLVTERVGRLRVVEKGKLIDQPLHVFREVYAEGEAGLMSLALHPDYKNNKELYVSLSYKKDAGIFNKVVRFRDDGNTLSNEMIIVDDIPSASYHAGCRIAFGPDGKLYITTGDATNKDLPQDKNSLAGKILRVNPDGSVPEDNPFSGSLVWSFGHRNPQGIAWLPETHELYATEHGPSVFDGPAGGDEVNRIVKGGNYGWPLVSHERKIFGAVNPLLLFTPAEAPASVMFYHGLVLPQFNNNLFFGALAGEGIVRIVIDTQNPDHILAYEKLAQVQYGRIREIVQGPDGYIYFSTSNRDGRGNPDVSDDRIFRIRPAVTSLNSVLVENLHAHDVVKKTFDVSGVARGTWFFEGSFPVNVRDEHGAVLVQTYATAQGDWMTENFVPFHATIILPEEVHGLITLILKKDNPSGLAEYDAEISLPLVVE